MGYLPIIFNGLYLQSTLIINIMPQILSVSFSTSVIWCISFVSMSHWWKHQTEFKVRLSPFTVKCSQIVLCSHWMLCLVKVTSRNIHKKKYFKLNTEKVNACKLTHTITTGYKRAWSVSSKCFTISRTPKEVWSSHLKKRT